jgi:hypothetical protein
MSWHETDIASILQLAGAWLAVGLALVIVVVMSARMVRSEREVRRLQREVVVFAEASTRVADTLDQLLLGNVAPTRGSHTSRRYLLSEALAGLESGESLDALSERLGLSHDEVHLLQRTARTLGTGRAQQAA